MTEPTEWVMVPREPTDEMHRAGRMNQKFDIEVAAVTMWASNRWAEMLSAAPTPPAPDMEVVAPKQRIAVLEWELAYTIHLRKRYEKLYDDECKRSAELHAHIESMREHMTGSK